MELNNIQINKVKKIVSEIYSAYFFDYKIDLNKVENLIVADYDFMQKNNVDNFDGIIALIIYRLSFEVAENYKSEKLIDVFYKIKKETLNYTTSYISPYSIILSPVLLKGENVLIDKGFKIYNNVVICNGVKLIDKTYGLFDKKVTFIKSNTIINNNVKIYANSNIGEKVEIGDGCTIRENISDNSIVSLITDLQIKKSKLSSRIPSQELNVFGVVPKYKNTFVIYGEGFYNPKVKLLSDSYNVETEISYWDKNKIIVKIKSFNIKDFLKNMLILFSNGQRIVLSNNIGLQKTLKNLQK